PGPAAENIENEVELRGVEVEGRGCEDPTEGRNVRRDHVEHLQRRAFRLTEDDRIQLVRVIRPPHTPHRKNLVDEQQPARIDRGQSPRHRRPPPANATNATDTSYHTAPNVSAITIRSDKRGNAVSRSWYTDFRTDGSRRL